jgi:hypothetical protein
MTSKEPQQEKTYISKLIPKDLLPLLLQQLWWKGFDEAQKKFPSEGTSNVAVDRLIKGMFIEFDEDATRKKVTEMINTAYKIGYIHDTSYLSDLTVDDALEICVDAILSLITGATPGRKQ